MSSPSEDIVIGKAPDLAHVHHVELARHLVRISARAQLDCPGVVVLALSKESYRAEEESVKQHGGRTGWILSETTSGEEVN